MSSFNQSYAFHIAFSFTTKEILITELLAYPCSNCISLIVQLKMNQMSLLLKDVFFQNMNSNVFLYLSPFVHFHESKRPSWVYSWVNCISN